MVIATGLASAASGFSALFFGYSRHFALAMVLALGAPEAVRRCLPKNVAANAKLTTWSSARGEPYVVVNRIAVEELAAWYFGDWEVVR